MKNIFEKLKKLRKSKGLTQLDMADKLGLTQPNYATFESGKNEITLSRLEKISEVFGISVLELLGGEAVSVPMVDNTELENLRKENEVLRKNVKHLEQIKDLLEDAREFYKDQYSKFQTQKDFEILPEQVAQIDYLKKEILHKLKSFTYFKSKETMKTSELLASGNTPLNEVKIFLENLLEIVNQELKKTK